MIDNFPIAHNHDDVMLCNYRCPVWNAIRDRQIDAIIDANVLKNSARDVKVVATDDDGEELL